jgi:parvulin-like peptidyl-prolyl isomerase
MAEKKSISETHSQGGEIRDVTRFYYGKDVAPILAQMVPGQLSRPIKVPKGYALVLMIGKREAVTTDTVPVWDLMQAVVVSGSSVDKTLSDGKVEGCDAFTKTISNVALSDTVRRGQVSPSQLPVEVKDILDKADLEKTVGPIQTPEGSLYFMKCNLKEVSVVPDKATIREQIEMERMDYASKRLLSEARRDVVIEYK